MEKEIRVNRALGGFSSASSLLVGRSRIKCRRKRIWKRKGIAVFTASCFTSRQKRMYWILLGFSAFVASFFLRVDPRFPPLLDFPPPLFQAKLQKVESLLSPSDLLCLSGYGPSKVLKVIKARVEGSELPSEHNLGGRGNGWSEQPFQRGGLCEEKGRGDINKKVGKSFKEEFSGKARKKLGREANATK